MGLGPTFPDLKGRLPIPISRQQHKTIGFSVHYVDVLYIQAVTPTPLLTVQGPVLFGSAKPRDKASLAWIAVHIANI